MRNKIDKLLADFLGVEVGDITPEDSLSDDLHMTPSDIVDFSEILKTAGFDTNSLNLTEIETLGDLHEKFI